jgi:hypothetical protein
MHAFVAFMNQLVGRAIRVVAGLVLIYLGLAALGGTGGAVVALVGVVPLVMGLWGRRLVEFVPGLA